MTITTLTTHRPALPTVVEPHHGAYDQARQAWNLAADQRPAAVAIATTAEEVSAVVRFAADHGLRVAPQGTGHMAGALPSLEDAVLLRTALHTEVEIDPVARIARVQAGALWEDVVEAAAPHGLMTLHGSSPDVGVFGYTLGGGMSFFGRRHGVAVNHVTAIEVVTADGELRRVDAGHDPDLFWALRGGGGNFGVVTALEFRLFAVAEIFAGTTFWSIDQAREVLRAWAAWAPAASRDATTSARILCLPPLPEVPEPLRATPVVAIDGAVLGDPDDAPSLVAAFRGVGAPMIDTWARIPAPAMLRVHGDPEHPVPGIGDHRMLGRLDDAAIDAFVAVAGEGSGSPLLAAELRQLGGAFAEAPEGAGATGRFGGEVALFGVGLPLTPDLGQAIEAHLDVLLDAMAPWESGPSYLNFAENAAGSADGCYDEETAARLAAIRAEVDPGELFLASHRIPPAA